MNVRKYEWCKGKQCRENKAVLIRLERIAGIFKIINYGYSKVNNLCEWKKIFVTFKYNMFFMHPLTQRVIFF